MDAYKIGRLEFSVVVDSSFIGRIVHGRAAADVFSTTLPEYALSGDALYYCVISLKFNSLNIL